MCRDVLCFFKEKVCLGELNIISASFIWSDYVLKSSMTPWETWKRIFHGRNGSNMLVNSKKFERNFWNIVTLHMKPKSWRIRANDFMFSKIAFLFLTTLLKKRTASNQYLIPLDGSLQREKAWRVSLKICLVKWLVCFS